MPAPKRTQAPRRIRIRPLSPVVDGGRYAPKRCVGDRVTIAADIFSDGHEKLRAVVRYKAPGGRGWLEARDAPDRRPPQRRALGGDLRGRAPGALGVRHRGVDRPVRHLARRAGAQGRRRPGRPRRRALRGRGAARGRARPRQGRRRQAHDPARAERGARRRPRPRRSATTRRSRPSSTRRWRARRSATASPAPTRRCRSPSTGMLARFGAWYELFPRSWGGIKAVEEQVPALAELGFDVVVHDPDPPDRRHQPQGREQHAGRRPRRPRLALRGRRQGGRPRRRAPGAGHGRGRPLAVRHRARARHGRLHGLRHQRVRRPPVAGRAPGVVPPPPGRDAQVRGEPAQALPGHLQRQLGVRGLARPVGGMAADLPVLGRRRREGLPRRQPAHEAVRVLGVADRGGPQGRPRRDLPGRGVHPPRRHARAGQARLHAVLHVLHVEDLALGAAGVRQRARPHRRRPSTSGPTSSRSRRTSSRPTSCTAAPARSSPGSCWRPR